MELVDDLLTRPLHKGGEWTYLGQTWRPARGLRRWIGSNQKRRERLGILADMTVGEWMQEMRELLDWTRTGCEETWT